MIYSPFCNNSRLKSDQNLKMHKISMPFSFKQFVLFIFSYKDQVFKRIINQCKIQCCNKNTCLTFINCFSKQKNPFLLFHVRIAKKKEKKNSIQRVHHLFLRCSRGCVYLIQKKQWKTYPVYVYILTDVHTLLPVINKPLE